MIAFGTALAGSRREYEEAALPGIRRNAEPDSAILTRAGLTIWEAYDQMMEEAAALPELEALVLLHQDYELTDGSLPGRVRRLLRDPAVGLIGALGARGVTTHLYLSPEKLYGIVEATGFRRRFSSGSDEVEGVDGALLILAPWVVRGLRFGEPLAGGFHGYDADISLRVRAHGGKVVCDDIPHFHHRVSKDDFDAQRLAGIDLARRWDPALRPPEWEAAFQP
jgi:Glycosyltransferase like family